MQSDTSADAPRTLDHLAPLHNGIRSDPGWYFERGADALACAADLGAPPIDIPDPDRPARLEETRKGWLVFTCDRLDTDVFRGAESSKKRWRRNLGIKADQRSPLAQTAETDDFLRAVSVPGQLVGVVQPGFYFKTRDRKWLHYDKYKVECGLIRMGISAPKQAMGAASLDPWNIVRIPFETEYLEGRKWNLGAPQLRHPKPEPGEHPHWDKILGHIGKDLDAYLPKLALPGITTGADYLRAWLAFMVREPAAKAPYLFLWGEQNSGKSVLAEAIDETLITSGVVRADAALTSQSDFNGELAGAVLAVIEEKDIARAGAAAYNKIKDWVTSLNISIHAKGKTPHAQINYTRFIQCANSRDACPIFPGDSRITMIHVRELTEQEIPKRKLIARLNEQAAAFTHSLMSMELPKPQGRLCLPVVETDSKAAAIDANVDTFVAAIVERFQEHGPFDFAAKDLPALLGDGEWPKTMKPIRRKLESYAPYLKRRGIIASIREVGHDTFRAYIAPAQLSEALVA